jgi:alcohol dehydrogenase
MPKTNLVGVGAIKDLPNELMPLKLSKALIVTDNNMITLGYVEMVERILKALFISYDIFDGVLHPNPTVSFVEDGLNYFPNKLNILSRDYDFLISIGGGTNHDCAKAIATVAANGGSIIDYEGWNKVNKPMLPTICINTTGSSGAEVTMYAIITDNSRNVKMVIGSPKLIPSICVNDPMFMSTMPKEITATSGYDVISQSIEAYVTTETSPITDALALDALRIACEYLPRAYENGNDMEAREKMMYAGMMAGMAFNNAGLGYLHSLVHQLGGFSSKPHGKYEACLLPYIIEFNAPAIPDERIFKIAEAMSITAGSKSKCVDKIMTSLKKLSSDLGLPGGLKEMGVEEEHIELLSKNALKDITALVNPRQGTLEDIMNLYMAAM